MPTRRSHLLAFVALASIVQAGCLVTSGSNVQEEGIRVSAATMQAVEPGQTTEAWLIAALGEPTARTPVTDMPNRQILRYDYVRSESSRGTVLFLFAGGSKRRESSRAFFEVTDGVVTKSWTEV